MKFSGKTPFSPLFTFMASQESFLGGLYKTVQASWQAITGANYINPYGPAVGTAPSYTDNVYKAVIPNFLYKPAFGYPLNKDVPEIRRLSKTPFVAMITNTVCNEVASLNWNVISREGVDVPDEIIEKTKMWFYNPNRNDESLDYILRCLVRGLLELDAGVIVKVKNLKGEFLEMYVRDGGCLDFNTLIETDKGDLPVGKIVSEKIKCNVKSWNFEENKLEWKPIINWVCNGPASKWIRLYTKSHKKYRSLTSTSHKIWTKDGWKLSEEIEVGDILFTQSPKLNKVQEQILVGSLLGDGCITGQGTEHGKFHYKETHSIKQKDYLLWKMKNFKELNPYYCEYKSKFAEGFKETVHCEFRTEKNIVFEEYRNLKYPIISTELIDKLDVLGLAVWFQDDGYCYKERDSVEFSTHCFPKEFLDYAVKKIKEKFGVEFKLRNDNRFEEKFIMYCCGDNARKFKELIKPFVYNSMAYKVNEEKLDNNELIETELSYGLTEVEVYRKEIIFKSDTRYDIEVKDNHNFFARGRLVSNTFTKSPDIYGIMPEDRPAYYQYGWLTGARPVPFFKDEIVYLSLNVRDDSIYGLSPVETLLDVIQLLTYGIDSNLEYFEDNNIPKGVFQMVGAMKDEVEAFSSQWSENLKKKDPSGKWRKYFHKMPVVNTEGKFERIGFSNLELDLIQQQKWFTKLVFACFNITPSELGFTEDVNRATESVQSNVVIKRKLIKPLMKLIEYYFNTEIVNDLPWIKGKFEDKVLFEFDKFDLQEELNKRQLQWGDKKNGIRTANEIREENNLEPMEGGDSLKKEGVNPFGFQTSSNVNKLNNQKENEEPAIEEEEIKKKSFKSLMTSSIVLPKEFEELSKPDFLKKKIEEELNLSEKQILEFLKRELGSNVLSELKAVDSHFVERVMQLFSFSKLKETVNKVIKVNFLKGLEKVELVTGRNFPVNENALNFLQNYTFENIKGLESDLKDKLRGELKRGIMNGDGQKELSKRIQSVIKVGKNRADMIARTETNRAENLGALDGYKQSGLKGKKEWVATLDKRTSVICKHLNGQKVDLNEKFVYKGEKFDAPPALPNCRSTIVFHPEIENLSEQEKNIIGPEKGTKVEINLSKSDIKKQNLKVGGLMKYIGGISYKIKSIKYSGVGDRFDVVIVR